MEEHALEHRQASIGNEDGPLSLLGASKQTTKYQRLESSNGQIYQAHKGPTSTRLNSYAIACALLASMNSILLGYDVGVISGALLFIKEDLKINEFQEEILVSVLSIVSLGGGAVAGRFADAVGRRATMAASAVVFLVGAVVMGVSPSFFVLMIGRLLAGFGVGLALMVAPVYTAEIAPASSRGSLVSLPEIFINIGILMGYVSNYVFSGLPAHIAWRIMLGLGILPAVSLAVGVLFMPESPRWLVMQNRIDEARVVITKTSSDSEEGERRLLEIMEAAGLVNSSDIEVIDSETVNTSSRTDNNGKTIWRELLCPSPPVRRMLLVSSGIQFFQQATGIDATVYYSPEAFRTAGIVTNSGVIAGTVAMGFTKCIFILVSVLYLDRVGRRPLLLVSTIGITTCLAILALCFGFVKNVEPDIKAGHSVGVLAVMVIIAVCFYVAFFSIGMGPICWVLTTEIFPLRLRAQAMSLGIVINRLSSSTVSMTFLSMSRAFTFMGTYLIFTGISLCSVLFIFFCVPETKGKTLEEVGKFFAELADATDNFNISRKIGKGGFATVFYGKWKGKEVAVKRMELKETHGFFSELRILSNVHHANLVDLLGYCTEGHLFLVYEYMKMGTLNDHLRAGSNQLQWETRVKIALDAARGVEYMHEYTKPVYIHRDLKPSNILLDSNFHAKVGDFGLTRIVDPDGGGWTNTGTPLGTYGYMPPEYAQFGKVSVKTDVYAFGVILFQLISGRDALDGSSRQLSSLFKDITETADDELLKPLVDPKMDDVNPFQSVWQMVSLATRCTDKDDDLRPSMSEVVMQLMALEKMVVKNNQV